jgi:GntR family transcriptional regulator/MocR family aminotransferase
MAERGRQPKYEFLHRCIRSDIRYGRLKTGEQLPSKRALARHLGVSVSTVEQAYDLLSGEGYVVSRPGSGFYVCGGRGDSRLSSTPLSGSADSTWGQSVIDFKANRCSMNLFPADTWFRLMRRVISDRKPGLFETVPYNGILELRSAIAEYLYEFKGIETDPDCIVIGAGTEYLYGRLLQLLGQNSMVAIGDPGSKKFVELSQGAGTSWCYVPVDSEGLRVDRLVRTPANVVHVSPANNFPTGVVMSAPRRRQLLDWSQEQTGRIIVEDDYDSELRYSGHPLPALFTQDRLDRVVYLNTFSKTLVPSIRISYMVLPRSLAKLYRSQLSFYSCTVSSFEQYTLAAFIREGHFERHVNRLRRYYDKQRKIVVGALRTSSLMEVAKIRPVEVGTHVLVEVRTQLGDDEVKARAAKLGMNVNMLSDYCVAQNVRNAHLLVVNFASIVPENMNVVVETLENVFHDDIAQARG